MRRRLVVLALVVFALLAAAIRDVAADGTTAPSARSSPLTGAELRWIRGYARWSIQVDDAGLGPAGREELRDCAAVLRTSAGPAPTQRIRAAKSHVDEACSAVLDGGSRGAVDEHLARADDELARLLFASSPLRVLDEASSDSRRSGTLAAIATSRAREEIVVQCWSERDWRRVIREEAAWTDSEDEPGLIDGLAEIGSGRIELLLEDCNLLGRLRDEHVALRNREGLIAAADALSTFSHEIEHFRDPDASEADVECAAVDGMADVGRALGVDGREADLLHAVYLENVRPQLGDEYVKSCTPA